LPTRLRRNESPIYTLVLDGKDLLVGTASGLPCRLALEQVGEGWRARTKIEYAGWEAVGVECIARKGWDLGRRRRRWIKAVLRLGVVSR
jgi:hypothetical protein